MSALPDFVSRTTYLKSKKLIKEAEVARERAVLIHICSKLETGYTDWHGAVESSQHCFELSLKALWLMLGLDYPCKHNPAEDLNLVKERLFRLFPHLENNPLFQDFEKWVMKKGEYMARLHLTSFYGDEKGKCASEIFTEEDAFRTWEDAEMAYKFALTPIALTGQKLGLLTEEEKEHLETISKLIEKLRENAGDVERDKPHQFKNR
jgi:HEPN domain-containing protein